MTDVDNYAKYAAPYGPWMKELLLGVGDLKKWTLTKAGDRVTGAYPTMDGHPSHGQGKEWKMNVERGTASQDRMWVKVTEILEEPSKSDPEQINVKIKATVSVAEDTHQRDSRK